MFRFFIEKDFELKERKRKTKRKMERIEVMIYVEYINLRWNILKLFKINLLK